MKRFVHYAVEGLVRQGPHCVWINMGNFASAEEAGQAAERRRVGQEVVESRIIPLYRDSDTGYSERSPAVQSRIRNSDLQTPSVPVTVA